ncbi:hypothetical protein PGB90_003070 [Kerria lacca]
MIRLKKCFLLFIVLINYIKGENEEIKITIKQGSLKGKVQQSRNGSKYYTFLSIPYAKPPVGELRFKPPKEPEAWDDEVKDATIPSPICFQKKIFLISDSTPSISEDCLYLNVYTPQISEANLPVIVYIHGGSLISGYGSQYQPDYILDNSVVFVTFNYRLGILGFLSAVDDILPGNYGLKDQVAALRWVQKNIAAFGGDPKQVTLFGSSAGGTSVDFHLYSPLSTGLFQRAIVQSGSALSFWSYTSSEIARQKAFALGLLSGCTGNTTRVLLKCLQKIPAKELIETHDKFLVWHTNPIPFSIVIEPKNVKDAFVTENPWKYRVINDVPIMFGITSGEGGLKAYSYLSNNGKLADEINENYKRLFPIIFNYGYWLPEEKLDVITEKLKHFYFGNKSIGMDTAKELVDIHTDVYFAYPSIKSARRHPASVYYYYYNHKNKFTIGQLLGDYKKDLGVCHGDDVLSLFPFVFPKITDGPDLSVSQRMIKYFYNFAKTGNPNEKEDLWKPVTSDDFEYLHITTDEDKMENFLLNDRYTFWKNLEADPVFDVEFVKLLKDEF